MFGLTGIRLSDSVSLGSWSASNNAQSSSRGKWPAGTNMFSYFKSGGSRVGPNGIMVFDVFGRSGMGVHGGRGGNYTWPTDGCIRVSDSSMGSIMNWFNQYPTGFIQVIK